MDLTKLTNKESKDKNQLDTVAFDDIKTFIVNKEKEQLPGKEDTELNTQIDNMLNRWGVQPGKDRDDLKTLAIKLYHGRLADGKSRAFWSVLKENIPTITSAEAIK